MISKFNFDNDNHVEQDRLTQMKLSDLDLKESQNLNQHFPFLQEIYNREQIEKLELLDEIGLYLQDPCEQKEKACLDTIFQNLTKDKYFLLRNDPDFNDNEIIKKNGGTLEKYDELFGYGSQGNQNYLNNDNIVINVVTN